MKVAKSGDKQKHSSYSVVLAAFLCGFAVLSLAYRPVRKFLLKDNSMIFTDKTRKQHQESSHRLAVARTFCTGDAKALAESFDQWNDLSPCEHGSDMKADLFLVFSQSLSASPVAQAAVDSIEQKFHETEGWNGCFSRLVAIGVDIDSETDLYQPKQQQTNHMWVNGPNRQFERTIREIQSGVWGDYESMYLMERDSVPVKSFWLDALVSDIEKQQPFAILGRCVFIRADKSPIW